MNAMIEVLTGLVCVVGDLLVVFVEVGAFFLARRRSQMKNPHFSGFLTGVIVTGAVLSAVAK